MTLTLPEIEVEIAYTRKRFKTQEHIQSVNLTIKANDELVKEFAQKYGLPITEPEPFNPYIHCLMYDKINGRQLWIWIAGDKVEITTVRTYKQKAPAVTGA